MEKFAIFAGFLLVVALSSLSGAAHAVLINYALTASGFEASPPEDPVSGSFRYEAASISDPIMALSAITLTIAGHTYALGDVPFANPSLFTVVAASSEPTKVTVPTKFAF